MTTNQQSEHTPLPWAKRGSKLVVPGTQKTILEFSIAWKGSAEYAANIEYVYTAVNERPKLLARIKRLEEALRDAEVMAENVRVILVTQLDEPVRSAFWKAVEIRNRARAALTE